jgi:polyhydroxyalkanoate synthesis regulator phasin
MLDAVKNYLSLASGVTEVTRQRATAAAKALAASGEATAEQVSNLADDLVINSRNNRDAMLALVRYELDRALSRLGLATADEVTSLQRRVTILEGALALAAKGGAAEPGDTPDTPRRPAKATKAAKASPANASPAKSPAKSSGTSSATKATKANPAKAPARKTAAKATAARATAAKSSPTKKATSAGSS